MLEVNARIGYNARQYPVSSPIQKSATLMMPQDLQAHMRKVSYLEALSEAECRELARRCQARTFGNAELIFTEGAPADGLWLVERGSVKVFKLGADGTEHILHLLARGNTFNEIAALDGGVNPAHAASLHPETLLWLLPCDVLQRVVSQNPAVALATIRFLTQRVRALVNHIENIALYSVVVRLARFLFRQEADPALRAHGITRTAIAAHINTTPQTVSVALRELEASGAIQFNRHQIIIVDETILRAIALL